MVGAVQPFEMTAAIPFKNQYLSGFLTEKRDNKIEKQLLRNVFVICFV